MVAIYTVTIDNRGGKQKNTNGGRGVFGTLLVRRRLTRFSIHLIGITHGFSGHFFCLSNFKQGFFTERRGVVHTKGRYYRCFFSVVFLFFLSKNNLEKIKTRKKDAAFPKPGNSTEDKKSGTHT